MKKIIIFTCAFSLIFSFTIAHSKIKKYTSQDRIILRIEVTDSTVLNEENQQVTVTVSKYPIAGFEFVRSNSKTTYVQNIKKNQVNEFQLPTTERTMYVKINCTAPIATKRNSFNDESLIYKINSGSNIYCIIDENGYNFKGKGSDVLNIQNELVRLNYKLPDTLQHQDTWKVLHLYDLQADLVLQKQLEFIKNHKKELGRENLQLFTANCYGYRYYSQFALHYVKSGQDTVYLNTLRKYYFGKTKIGLIPVVPDSILVNSPNYANYILEEVKLLKRIKLGFNIYSTDEFISAVLSHINEKYTGALRDKLASLFFIRMSKKSSTVQAYEKYITTMHDPKYIKMLQDFFEPMLKGKPYMNYQLANHQEKIYTPASFNGKVMVMDYWYTGCVNCIILNEAMHPVYEHFKNNDQVVFVSISIDKSKDIWLKSIKEGKYTHDNALNLYTNGEGKSNELIKFYNITGYPTVHIVRNGAMFSANPPLPTIGIQSGLKISKGATDLINMIEEACKQ